eukprot:732720-Heterocapsa_arctica.AAC.1
MGNQYVFHNIVKMTIVAVGRGRKKAKLYATDALALRAHYNFMGYKEEATLVEGGERGAEMALAADLGGLQFFCISVEEPG